MRSAVTPLRTGPAVTRPGVARVWCALRGLASLCLVISLAFGVLPGVGGSLAYAASPPSGYQVFERANLVINGKQVKPDVPFLVYAGRMLVPIRIVAETLGASVNWDGARQVASVDTGGRHIELIIGAKKASVDSASVDLDAPAALYMGRTLVPLRFVAEALGCEVAWDSASRTASVQAPQSGGMVTAVETELLPEYAVLHIRTDGPVRYDVSELADPPRLVVDVQGVTPNLGWTEKLVDQALVHRVRVGSGASGTASTRVVCDLVETVEFGHRQAANGYGVDLLVYYKVSGLAWENGGLTVKSSGPVDSKAFTLSGPDRFVIDLPGASLAAGVTGIDVGAGSVQRVRVAQNQTSPDIVRVVLDLLKPVTFTVARSEQGLRVLPEGVTDPPGGTTGPTNPQPDPGGSTGQTIRYEKTASGGRLTLTFANDFTADVTVASDGRELQLQIAGPAMSGLAGATVADGLVESYALTAAENGSGFAVVVHLAAYAGHQLGINGRQVTLDLARSAVIGRRIVLDPGHGGRDPGCTSYSGVYEKYVNWPIALALKARLEQAGATVGLTKASVETSIDGYERAAFANNWGADIFVSIHCNAHITSVSSGTEVYHLGDSAQSLRLAQLMMNSLAKLGLPNRGVRTGNYVVCRETNMPAILIEMGFLTNPTDEQVLLDPEGQARIADLMAEAIQSYFR